MTTANTAAEVAQIERALSALLAAMREEEARRPEPAPYRIRATPFDPSKVIRSRAEMEIAQLLREPVYFVLRLAARCLPRGQHPPRPGRPDPLYA